MLSFAYCAVGESHGDCTRNGDFRSRLARGFQTQSGPSLYDATLPQEFMKRSPSFQTAEFTSDWRLLQSVQSANGGGNIPGALTHPDRLCHQKLLPPLQKKHLHERSRGFNMV